MFFNSLDFALFIPVVFFLYWYLLNNGLKTQNFFVLVASYIFYGWWDWRFLTLIFFSTGIDFFIGLRLPLSQDKLTKKLLLISSMSVNLGILGFFKYYNFFVDSFIDAFSLFGFTICGSSLDIILPVGISFYTFQTMSYTIDIYNGKLKPTRDFISFAAFVSFFPQLVAGPIERASNLLPQFFVPRRFDYSNAVDGMRLILWGLFKKVVIADTCAVFVNDIFANTANLSGSTLLLGGIFFAFQIYGDFSGYSDIAIGVSQLFGFKLKRNFAYPYFSRDIAEFWRRWHISLSTWFRDYLYIPLGGSRGNMLKKTRNTFIVFLVSGFWHGANWTFIVWGALNALYFLPLLILNKNRQNIDFEASGRILPSIKDLFSMTTTFMLTVIAWIIFRAENMGHTIQIFEKIFSLSLFTAPFFGYIVPASAFMLVIGIFVLIEFYSKNSDNVVKHIVTKLNPIKRTIVYFLIGTSIFLASGIEQEFIYFQF